MILNCNIFFPIVLILPAPEQMSAVRRPTVGLCTQPGYVSWHIDQIRIASLFLRGYLYRVGQTKGENESFAKNIVRFFCDLNLFIYEFKKYNACFK